MPYILISYFRMNRHLSANQKLQSSRRDDLIKKMEADFKSFSPERVEEEVNKFMMDAEGVNMYIRYLKDKEENPGKYAQQALEQELSL